MNDGCRGDRAVRDAPRQAGPGRPGREGPLPLAGRTGELAALDEVAEQVLAGQTRVVQLAGNAGMGKSALLHHWLDGVRRFREVRVRCHRLRRDFAFGAVRRLLHPVVAAAGEQERRALLDGVGDTVLRILDPEGPWGGDPDTYADAAETLAGLDRLAFRLSRREPLLLAVDDLQWIDPPSLRWLAHLVHRADTHPILVAVTTRTGERPAPGDLYDALVHPAACRTLALEPLRPADVARLVALEFGEPRPDPSFCAACHAATEGHPLFLRALLCDARRGGIRPTREDRDRIRSFGLPTLLREVRQRVGQGSPAVAELARGLAVLGDGMPWSLLAAYCGTGEAVVRSAGAELRSLGLLGAGEEPRFVHRVVRDAVLAEWTPQEVGAAHARAAQVLHLSGRPDEEVAAHVMAAGPVSGTWPPAVLRRAAGEALRRGAAETAVTYLRHAVFQPATPGEHARVFLELAVAASHYDTALAASYATAALENLTDDDARSKAVAVLAYSHLMSRGGRAGSPDLARLATELSTRTGAAAADRESLLRMQALIEWLELERPSIRGTVRAEKRATAVDLDGRTSGERQLLAVRAFAALRAGEPADRVTELVDRARANSPALSHDLFPLHYFVAGSLLYLDDLDGADALCGRLLDGTKDRGMELLASSLMVYRSAVALRRGHVAQAAEIARTASERPRAHGELPYRMTLDTITLDALLAQGDLEGAEHLAASHTAVDQAEPSWEWPRFLMSLAALRAAQRDHRGALTLLRESGQHFETAGIVSPAIGPWRSRAAAVSLRLGYGRDARALAEEELELARRCRIPRTIGVALHAVGRVTGGTQGLDLVEEAVSVLERTPAELELARALHTLGCALLRRDDKPGARTALRRGLELAVKCGASAAARNLQHQLHEAGGRTPDPCSLTAGEERVAALAAEGWSNKQIAEHLYVSLRTVETHLTAAYRKLCIGGRHELPEALKGVSYAVGRVGHA
ncbi:LuxR family transcriptional regulator [Streptomyces sp. WAC 06783]|uniref:helix-turn-helix transcriptional regulator n=1 Tax=Streptomyces sp. WAC 06783 TaxID=2203211 RepID=UPI000F746402|nr:AAA family ATPase [Streptomyces sp. WAC 06783]RSO10860.1 LuxR family transcriptional regulator [Streptomyces sp. WAC 06783]